MVDDWQTTPLTKLKSIFLILKKKPFHTHSVLVSQAYDFFVAEIMSVQTSKEQSLWHQVSNNIVKTQDSRLKNSKNNVMRFKHATTTVWWWLSFRRGETKVYFKTLDGIFFEFEVSSCRIVDPKKKRTLLLPKRSK